MDRGYYLVLLSNKRCCTTKVYCKCKSGKQKQWLCISILYWMLLLPSLYILYVICTVFTYIFGKRGSIILLLCQYFFAGCLNHILQLRKSPLPVMIVLTRANHAILFSFAKKTTYRSCIHSFMTPVLDRQDGKWHLDLKMPTVLNSSIRRLHSTN